MESSASGEVLSCFNTFILSLFCHCIPIRPGTSSESDVMKCLQLSKEWFEAQEVINHQREEEYVTTAAGIALILCI